MPETTTEPILHVAAGRSPPDGSGEQVSRGMQLATLAAVIVPFLGLIVAGYLSWGRGFHRVELGLLAGLYVLTGLGITVGFHRLFTHRSFETRRPIEVLLAIFGSMAVQGTLLEWVARHRRHHQHSDRPDDPHSPHQHGGGMLGLLRGAWHAHIGWAFARNRPNLSHYVKDLQQDSLLRLVSALFPVWVVLGLLIPAAAGGLLTGSWTGAWTGLLWGGLVRICLVHHVTWSINSVCHLWGTRPYPVADQSRNNLVFGVLALGEGWHNNHHTFPTSARHGLRWWQVDLSYYVIRTLALTGLAWNVRLPAARAALSPDTRESLPIAPINAHEPPFPGNGERKLV